jgi:predicted ATPase
MLKRLIIQKFKAIQGMTVEFTPLTVLIGGNSCGKSTVLQAIDFLRFITTRDIPEYLREHGWSFEDLKSKGCSDNKPIEFVSFFEFTIDNEIKEIKWYFSVDFQDKKWIIKESFDDGSSIFIIGFTPEESIEMDRQSSTLFHDVKLESSSLKLMDDHFFSAYRGGYGLQALKQFMESTSSFELLSPDRMRSGYNPPDVQNIGAGGSTLAACIYSMTNEQREKLNKMVSDLIETKIDVKTINLGKKIELLINEKNSNVNFDVNNQHISDGLLRIIAFVVISLESEKTLFITENGMILLDEIEDGINPYLTEKIIGLLQHIVTEQNRQIIITTHSPIILDYITPQDIVFMWRDKTGNIYCEKMFSTEKMQHVLKALNPGEVWVNLEKDQILERLGAQ